MNTAIHEGPRSLNVTLGSKARFTCEGVGNILIWRIDGFPPEHVKVAAREVEDPLTVHTNVTGGLISMLNVSALRVNDEAEIVCSAVGSSTSESSDSAILRIQGNEMTESITMYCYKYYMQLYYKEIREI